MAPQVTSRACRQLVGRDYRRVKTHVRRHTPQRANWVKYGWPRDWRLRSFSRIRAVCPSLFVEALAARRASGGRRECVGALSLWASAAAFKGFWGTELRGR